MGAATHHFPPDRPLTEQDRVAAVHAALADGTVTRIRDLMGWSTCDLAERLNVLPSLVDGWLTGETTPSPYASAKLWTVLVCAIRYEDAPAPQGPLIRLP